jgi:hypothetical protein
MTHLTANDKQNVTSIGENRLRHLAILVAAMLLTSGCRLSPKTHERVQLRHESLARTVMILAEQEQIRAEKLANAERFLAEALARRAQLHEHNANAVQRWIQYDLHRWQANQPVYWQVTEYLLRGKPENIPDNAILLFY